MQTAVKTPSLALAGLMLISMAFDVRAVTTIGAPPCSIWAQYSSKAKNDYLLAEKSWLLGYLSGMGTQTGKDVLRGVDETSLWLWMENYCKANLLKDSDEAGRKLFLELVKQKKL